MLRLQAAEAKKHLAQRRNIRYGLGLAGVLQPEGCAPARTSGCAEQVRSLILGSLLLCSFLSRLSAATLTVSNTIDRAPTNAADRIEGSLRQAIMDANAAPGPDIIQFQLGGGARIIYTNSAPMPPLSGPVSLLGFNPDGSRTELIGTNANINNQAAFVLNGGNSVVRGFVIRGFGTGILIQTNGFNRVEGNFIGTDFSGTVARPNRDHGIQIINSRSNIIGGLAAEARNIISGNGSAGVICNRRESIGNQIIGNYIGTDVTGRLALPNQEGVGLFSAVSNQVGGLTVEARNVISGNNLYGIDLSNLDCLGNIIQGNFIGVDATGQNPLANGRHGIFSFRAGGSLIGGMAAGARNIISGNLMMGVVISQPASPGSVIAGNYIGLDVTGTKGLPNGQDGVILSASYSNVVGGSENGAGNVIAGNGEDGITVVGAVSTNNTIQGNLIGTDASGTIKLGNAFDGVTFELGASDNLLGGPSAGPQSNVIAGNGGDGVGITDSRGVKIQGNFIGVDRNGLVDLGNGEDGVFIGSGSSGNRVGIPGAAGNVIAFNGHHGIFITAGDSNGISGNAIFSNAQLGIDLAPDGFTANDAADPDSGANALQNFPVLTSAQREGARLIVRGSLNSAPNTVYRIELFINDTCAPAGKSEGARSLGSTTVTTAADGNAILDLTFPTANQGGGVTATASDPLNNTSEFSPCLEVSGSQVVELGFTRAGNQITLVWPASFAGYILESTDNLASPVWMPVPGQPQVVNGQNRLTLEIGSGTRFFRLRKP